MTTSAFRAREKAADERAEELGLTLHKRPRSKNGTGGPYELLVLPTRQAHDRWDSHKRSITGAIWKGMYLDEVEARLDQIEAETA